MKKILSCLVFALSMFLALAQTVSLDDAIASSAKKFEEKMDKGTKVVVLNFKSPSEKLSEYVIEEIMFTLVNSGKLAVIERDNIEMVKDELKFQISGDVSDESAQSIGKILGAKVIISGSFDDSYRFRLKVIAVESAQLLAVNSANIAKTGKIEQLLGISGGAKTAIIQSFNNPGSWNTFTDNSQGGDSVVNMKTGKETIRGTSYMVVSVTGKVTDTYKYGYMGVNVLPDTDTLEMMKNAKGIKFKIIGDGHPYRVEVETTDIMDIDFNCYGMDITPKKGEIVEVTVPYSIMKQGMWGKVSKFNADKIYRVTFKPIGVPLKSVSFKIFDLLAYE